MSLYLLFNLLSSKYNHINDYQSFTTTFISIDLKDLVDFKSTNLISIGSMMYRYFNLSHLSVSDTYCVRYFRIL